MKRKEVARKNNMQHKLFITHNIIYTYCNFHVMVLTFVSSHHRDGLKVFTFTILFYNVNSSLFEEWYRYCREISSDMLGLHMVFYIEKKGAKVKSGSTPSL